MRTRECAMGAMLVTCERGCFEGDGLPCQRLREGLYSAVGMKDEVKGRLLPDADRTSLFDCILRCWRR